MRFVDISRADAGRDTFSICVHRPAGLVSGFGDREGWVELGGSERNKDEKLSPCHLSVLLGHQALIVSNRLVADHRRYAHRRDRNLESFMHHGITQQAPTIHATVHRCPGCETARWGPPRGGEGGQNPRLVEPIHVCVRPPYRVCTEETRVRRRMSPEQIVCIPRSGGCHLAWGLSGVEAGAWPGEAAL